MKTFKVSSVLYISLVLLSCSMYKPSFEYDDLATRSHTIEIVFIQKGLPCINAIIKGNKYLLAVDMGLTNQVITLKDKHIPNVSEYKSNHFSMVTNVSGAIGKEYYYNIESIHLGDLILRNIDVLPEKRTFVPDEVDGLLGLEFFRRFNVLLDYREKKLILFDKEVKFAHNDWQEFHFDLTHYGMLATLSDKINTYDIALDTGSWDEDKNDFFYLSNAYKGKETDTTSIKEYFIGGQSIGKYRVEICNYQIPFDGFLGYGFFSRYKVFIDYSENIVCYK